MLCTKEKVDMSVNKYMSVNKMRSSEEEMGGSARLGNGRHQEKEHSYSLPVDQLTSGFVACPHCGIWVSKARSFVKVNAKTLPQTKRLKSSLLFTSRTILISFPVGNFCYGHHGHHNLCSPESHQ